jgi:hypothetical protein
VTSFQVPLYALALRAAPELAWTADATIEGGYVLLRGERKLLVRPIAAPMLALDVEARRDAGGTPIANRMVALVADAVAGRFDVEPRECSRFCAYRHVCRYQPPPEEGE